MSITVEKVEGRYLCPEPFCKHLSKNQGDFKKHALIQHGVTQVHFDTPHKQRLPYLKAAKTSPFVPSETPNPYTARRSKPTNGKRREDGRVGARNLRENSPQSTDESMLSDASFIVDDDEPVVAGERTPSPISSKRHKKKKRRRHSTSPESLSFSEDDHFRHRHDSSCSRSRSHKKHKSSKHGKHHRKRRKEKSVTPPEHTQSEDYDSADMEILREANSKRRFEDHRKKGRLLKRVEPEQINLISSDDEEEDYFENGYSNGSTHRYSRSEPTKRRTGLAKSKASHNVSSFSSPSHQHNRNPPSPQVISSDTNSEDLPPASFYVGSRQNAEVNPRSRTTSYSNGVGKGSRHDRSKQNSSGNYNRIPVATKRGKRVI